MLTLTAHMGHTLSSGDDDSKSLIGKTTAKNRTPHTALVHMCSYICGAEMHLVCVKRETDVVTKMYSCTDVHTLKTHTHTHVLTHRGTHASTIQC